MRPAPLKNPFHVDPTLSLSPELFISLTVAFALPSGPAVAAELERAVDVEALCALSEPVEMAFPLMGGSAAAREPEVTDAAESGAPVALPSVIQVEEEGEIQDGPDPVLEVFRAREYARERVAALVEPYEVVVPTSAFPGWSWEPLLGGVAMSAAAAFEAHGFLFEPVGAQRVIFPMGHEEAEMVLAAHALGAASLRVQVALRSRERPWQPICVHDSGQTRIEVEILTAELVDGWSEVPRARAATVAFVEERVRAQVARAGMAMEGVPLVEVMSMDVQSVDGCTSDEAALLQSTVEAIFPDCYLSGLAHNANLQGAMVLEFELESSGATTRPRVAIDVLENERVRDCVLAAVERMSIPRRSDAEPAAVRSRVRFALSEH